MLLATILVQAESLYSLEQAGGDIELNTNANKIQFIEGVCPPTKKNLKQQYYL